MTDDLMRALRDLPPELSGPADRFELVQAKVVRRRRSLAGASALAVVLVIVLVPWLWRSVATPDPLPTVPAAALECPAAYAGQSGGPGWVPSEPEGVDPGNRLVPEQAPARAVACSYVSTPPGASSGSSLADSRIVAGDLSGLSADLSSEAGSEHACMGMGTPDQVPYLLGLSYDSGTLWVSANPGPGGCGSTTNGPVIVDRTVGPWISSALAVGRWGATTDHAELVGRWAPVSITGYNGDLGGSEPLPPSLSFTSNLEVSGEDGCNSLWGTYQLSEAGLFRAESVGQSAVGCRGEVPLTETLEATRSVTVDGPTLTLYDADNEVLAVFRAEDATLVTSKQDLLGHWVPQSITGYHGDRLGRKNSRAALDFKSDGTVSGSDGCNGLSGTYTLSTSGELSARAQTSTLVGCVLETPPVLSAVQAARSATITDGLLTLLDAEGAVLAVFSYDSEWNPYEASLIDAMKSVGVRAAGSEEHGFGYNLFVAGALDDRWVVVHTWPASAPASRPWSDPSPGQVVDSVVLAGVSADIVELRVAGVDVVRFRCWGLGYDVASYPSSEDRSASSRSAAEALASDLIEELHCPTG